jgi:hypothetical protein
MTDLPDGFVVDQPPANAGIPEGFALDTPDLLSGLTNTAARWATFGLTDPVAALARAGAQKTMGNPESFGDLYSEKLAALRGQSTNFGGASLCQCRGGGAWCLDRWGASGASAAVSSRAGCHRSQC